MKKYMRVAILVVWTLASAASARATGPTSWIDVVGTFGADPTCTLNSGPAINNAIASAKAPGSVLFFQTGCYLITTEIVDINTAVSGLTYLGYGNVTLQAASNAGLPAILQLGDATHSVTGRNISNLVFLCSIAANIARGVANAIDGIDVYGLTDSAFEDVQILNFANHGLLATASPRNSFHRGVISSVLAGQTGNNGAVFDKVIGISLSPGSDNWTVVGTKVGPGSLFGGPPFTALSIGIEIRADAFACINCNVGDSWAFGIVAALDSPVHGLEISGGSYTGNINGASIRIGAPGDPHWKAYGVSIHGAEFDFAPVGGSQGQFCIDLEQANGFSIIGNTFNCAAAYPTAIRALADNNTPGQVAGADNGVVGPNQVNNLNPYQLEGRNITLRHQACTSNSSPASCSTAASSGIVALSAGTFTLTVNDPFVSATSRIVVSEDMTLGAQLGVTCNTVGGRTYSVTSKVAQTSFTVTSSTAPSGNPACLVFHMEN